MRTVISTSAATASYPYSRTIKTRATLNLYERNSLQAVTENSMLPRRPVTLQPGVGGKVEDVVAVDGCFSLLVNTAMLTIVGSMTLKSITTRLWRAIKRP